MTYNLTIKPILVYNYVTFNPVTWLYALIRWWTKSQWNHCVIEVTSNIDGQYINEIYDSNFRGVISRPYSRWYFSHKRRCAYIEIPTDKSTVELLVELKSHQGKMYQFGVYLSRLFGKRKSGSDTLYCFELIEKVYGIERATDGRDYEQYIVSRFTT